MHFDCIYHIVLNLKYRRRIMYGSHKKDIIEVIKTLVDAGFEVKQYGSCSYVYYPE